MTNKITDLENPPQQPKQQHTSSILSKDLAQLQPLSEERNKYASYLKDDIYIHPDSIITDNVSIGSGTRINGPAFIVSGGKNFPVTIGKYCAIGYELRIRSNNHHTGYANLQIRLQVKYGFRSIFTTKGAVTIGNNVWIGDKVLILSGVNIGDGAVIGAGSIVTKNIEPYSIAVGNPAKVIKKRFSEQIINQFLEIKWWEWTEEKIKRNKKFFEIDFSQETELDINSIICS